jgi:sphinganine-1-phosphate aldolase
MDWFKSLKTWASTQTTSQMMEHSLVTFGVLYFAKKVYDTGLTKFVTRSVLAIPGAKSVLNDTLEKESQKALNDFLEGHDCKDVALLAQLPDEGWTESRIMEVLNKLKESDVKPETGKVWALVYAMEEEKHHQLIEKCHSMFLETNALNPMAFNSLRRMENDVVRMASHMLGGDKNVRGTLTTGGTESILLAVKSYREKAKSKTTEPEMILPTTIHPAFMKAAAYFQVKTIMIPVNDRFEADIDLTRKAINSNTILIVASAPQYPHGIIDPVEEFGKLALEYDIPLHVDSCIGGFVLPFANKRNIVILISSWI